jgi:thiol-disulfide isomerase/thioredoxin
MSGMSKRSMCPPLTRRRWLRLAAGTSFVPGAVARAQPAYELRPWVGVAPALRLADIDGIAWDLAALQGRVVLLNFWATWCEPCRAEMPSLERVARRHESEGLTVLAINFKESAPTIRRFLERVPLALPVLLDRDGTAARAWQTRIFPSTVLVDRAGRPRGVVMGEMDWAGEAAEALLQPLLAGKSRA